MNTQDFLDHCYDGLSINDVSNPFYAKRDKIAREHGPDDPEIPGRFILATRFGGPGLQVDGVQDAIGYQLKVAGDQHNPGESEDLALYLDAWLIGGISRTIQGKWVTSIARVGSPPVPLLVDDADRTHFICNYTVTGTSVLA